MVTNEFGKAMESVIKIAFGDVRKKKIRTTNHFVSHMIEHIAWRMGLMIEMEWYTDSWYQLGFALGKEIKMFTPRLPDAAALGMIDDGSAAVGITLNGRAAVSFSAVGGVDCDWFLRLRCEQVNSGQPLVDLVKGLSSGLEAEITIEIWSVEDSHHTWEGIYRGIGIALGKIYTPEPETTLFAALIDDREVIQNESSGEIVVREKGMHSAKVQRGTAETGVVVGVDFGLPGQCIVECEVDSSILDSIKDAQRILGIFAVALQAGLFVDFKATTLSSSHVVMEDIGLVAGRALLEIMKLRMENYGLQGAGSTLNRVSDMQCQNLRVGVSTEGRKFWRFIPADGDYNRFRKAFLIGSTVFSGLRSEDLDDFLDGLAGGLGGSIMVHVKDYSDVEKTWSEVFEALGQAISQSFQLNPYRRGVPPGVKATLA